MTAIGGEVSATPEQIRAAHRAIAEIAAMSVWGGFPNGLSMEAVRKLLALVDSIRPALPPLPEPECPARGEGLMTRLLRRLPRWANRWYAKALGSTNTDPAMDIKVQVRVLKAAVHVVYGVELAGWVVESIQKGEIKLDVRP